MEGNNNENLNNGTPAAEQPATPAPEAAKKPLYKKGWFWAAIAGAAAVVGGVAAYLLTGSDEAAAE